jgi:hypothetical protein
MKKAFTVALILTICCAMVGFAGTKWQFVKVFPDTTISFGVGVHGIAVDKENKIWVGPFGRTNSDSLGSTGIVAVYVYNPDGTEAAISRIKTIATTGRVDTLNSGGSIRGARADADGNVVIDGYFNTGGDATSKGHMWRLNYKTGAGMNHVGITGSQIAPAFTSANEMFTGNVAPGNPIRIWGSDFGSLGNAVEAASGYSRTIEVSKDGNDIYWCGYSLQKLYKYHSDNGTLGPYALTDSLAEGCQVESIGWNTKDGYLYFSAGPVDTINYAKTLPPWKHSTWYAMDAATKTIKDSIEWNWAAYPYNLTTVDMGPRPRGIAFSVTGDTAYLATYNHAKAAIQMFKRVATSVDPVNDGMPSGYTLSQNFPNPFNPSTEIQFTLTSGGYTTLKVYDMLGKEVATLVNENLNPGTYKTKFDASRLASGTYVYTLTSNGARLNNKMLLMK